jgi:uncharacterized protein (TIGR00369 family)
MPTEAPSGDEPTEAPSGDAERKGPEAGGASQGVIHSDVARTLSSFVPHNQALGIRFVEIRDGKATLALPYDGKLVGNPLTRVLHGGAITALMDATCGISVFLKLREPFPIATLDLRIDYLRPATPDEEVHARAECFRITEHVAFVRCEAFHPHTEADLVAVANGTFIITRKRPKRGERKKP